MAVNDSFAKSVDGLADAGTLIIDASGSGTGAVNITEVAGTASADVDKEYDPDGDTTYEVTTLIESTTGGFHSQGNNLIVSQSENTRLVITNTSGGTADFAVSGYEIDN